MARNRFKLAVGGLYRVEPKYFMTLSHGNQLDENEVVLYLGLQPTNLLDKSRYYTGDLEVYMVLRGSGGIFYWLEDSPITRWPANYFKELPTYFGNI